MEITHVYLSYIGTAAEAVQWPEANKITPPNDTEHSRSAYTRLAILRVVINNNILFFFSSPFYANLPKDTKPNRIIIVRIAVRIKCTTALPRCNHLTEVRSNISRQFKSICHQWFVNSVTLEIGEYVKNGNTRIQWSHVIKGLSRKNTNVGWRLLKIKYKLEVSAGRSRLRRKCRVKIDGK